MEAVVEYEYDAVQDDELSLKIGEIISNVVPSEDGWMRGEVDGKKGVFPENFVQTLKSSDKHKVISDKKGQQKREAPARKSVRELAIKFKDGVPMGLGGPPPRKKVEKKRCKVLYDYKPENEDELELQVGDIVDFIKEVEDGWFEGASSEKTGVFPSNFVELINVEDSVVEENSIADSGGDTSEGETNKNTAKPKKVLGVGLGNIFEDGPIKLRSVGNKKNVQPQTEKNKPPEIKESTRPLPSNNNDVIKRDKQATGERAVVRFSYCADQPDELNLKEGEIVNVIDRQMEDDGWWRGEVNGRVGVFPDNFVELLPQEDLKPKKPPPPVASSVSSKRLYPKLSDKTDSHDNKKNTADAKNSFKKDIEIEKGLGSLRKPNIPPPIGKKPNKSTDPPKLPESAKPDHKSIVSSSTRETKNKGIIPHPHIEEKNDNHINEERVHFEELEPNSQKLVHLTASRAKGPKKRPPSSIFTPMDSEENNTDNNNSTDTSSPRDNTDKIKTQNNLDKKSPHEPLHDIREHREIKESRDVHLRDNRDVKEYRDVRESRHIPPQRPPAPDMSSSSGGSHLHKIVDDLQRELREIRSNTVSISAFNELKSELDSLKSAHTKKLRDLMNEVDEEKKIRLNTQVEIERIKKLLAETNV